MANTILTPRVILREAYAIAHQVSNFIMRTNRQYDSRFARTGAKIGQALDVRLPAKYTTRRGNSMSVQNHVERKVELPLATIDGIDLEFGQEELTFSLDDFSERVLRPAMTQLMATVEADALTQAYCATANVVGDPAAAINYRTFQDAGVRLTENLAPKGDRTMCFQPVAGAQFNDAVKGLFQSSERIREAYEEGVMGDTGGFRCYENTLVPSHVAGTYSDATATVNGAGQGTNGTGNVYAATTTLAVTGFGANNTIKKGTVITIEGVNAVHPESKQDQGYLRPFVVTADVTLNGSGAGNLVISPAIIHTGGAYQNVSAAPAGGADVRVVSGASGETIGQSLAFHRDAFAFVTADLIDPSQYGAWGAREVMDGLSLRIWRQGNIEDGTFPCRLDIAWGFAPIYPEWACRVLYDRSL